MPLQNIEIAAQIDAAPSTVYALLADSSTWPDWTPIDSYEQIEPPGPDGLGEVRRFTNGRVKVTERVVVRDPGHQVSYVLLGGLAVRDYRADIHLEPSGEGTSLLWRTGFRAKFPGFGPIYRRALHKATEEFVAGLKRDAESPTR